MAELCGKTVKHGEFACELKAGHSGVHRQGITSWIDAICDKPAASSGERLTDGELLDAMAAEGWTVEHVNGKWAVTLGGTTIGYSPVLRNALFQAMDEHDKAPLLGGVSATRSGYASKDGSANG